MAAAAALMFSCLVLWWLGVFPNHISTSAFVMVAAAAAVLVSLFLPQPWRLGSPALILSLCLLAGDLLWRLKPPAAFNYRPDEVLINHWPPMPALGRYRPEARFDAVSYGDLAAMAGRPDYREYRRVRFRSDRFGFPNDVLPDPVDAILLGDSFGAGTGTTQENTWGSLLRSRYGARVYDVSIPESGPWQELMMLKVQLPELRRSRPTTVIWAIFSGNDLDDDYGPGVDPRLSGWLEQMTVPLVSFRNRSPVRRITDRLWYLAANPHAHPVIEREFAPGRRILFRTVYANRAARSSADILAHPNFPRLHDVMQEMGRFASRASLAVTVVLLPSKEEVYNSILKNETPNFDTILPLPFAALVHEECTRAGLGFVDFTPAIRDEARRAMERQELLWWSDDTHWNTHGHALAASLVYRDVLKSGGAIQPE